MYYVQCAYKYMARYDHRAGRMQVRLRFGTGSIRLERVFLEVHRPTATLRTTVRGVLAVIIRPKSRGGWHAMNLCVLGASWFGGAASTCCVKIGAVEVWNSHGKTPCMLLWCVGFDLNWFLVRSCQRRGLTYKRVLVHLLCGR